MTQIAIHSGLPLLRNGHVLQLEIQNGNDMSYNWQELTV